MSSSSIGSFGIGIGIGVASSAAAPAKPPAAPPNASADLAKYESQLADWAHCPSSKTPEGKAKIAEITAKIDEIKTEVKRADDAKPAKPATPAQPPADAAAPQQPRLRLDLLGTWLNAQA